MSADVNVSARASLCPTKPTVPLVAVSDEPPRKKVVGSYGRHLVATRDIAAGEDIFTDLPLVAGPWSTEVPVCAVCMRNENLTECENCEYELCNEKSCQDSHCREECKLICASLKYPTSPLPMGVKYPLLTVLRMLSLSDAAATRLIYLSAGVKPPDHRHHLHRKILKLLGTGYDAESVMRALGIRYTNAKSLSTVRADGCIAIYPLFSLMNSDCCGRNTETSIDVR